jgi:hypothetical protein
MVVAWSLWEIRTGKNAIFIQSVSENGIVSYETLAGKPLIAANRTHAISAFNNE